jgi:septal ring factor EnvC (AmiA/AmiB activator)
LSLSSKQYKANLIRRAGGLAHATAVSAVAICLVGASVRAENTPQPSSVDEANKRLEERRTELENVEKRQQELQKDLSGIAAERKDINARLVETAALVQRSEAQLTAIEGRLSELDSQEKLLRGSLAQRRGQISRLLAALQRMGRNPPPVIITRREDALQMVRSAMLIATTFPEMRTQALALANKLNDLVRIMNDIRTEGDKLKAETSRLNETRTRLASLLETKRQTQTDRQAELKQVRQAATEISKNVNDLSDLITKLDQEVSKSTSLGQFDKETEQKAAAATPAPPASAPPDAKAGEPAPQPPQPSKPDEQVAMNVPPAKPSGPSVVELAPAGASLVPGSPNRIKPAIPFIEAKGKLALPAQGRRVLSYGDKTQYGGTSKGLVIETRYSAQVTSPCDGWIVYAGEFRSYGQLLIMNAGGGYHVLMAGLSQIDVQPGQFVLASEPVGTMSGAPRTAQLAVQSTGAGTASPSPQSNAPVIYVEFRKDGQPLDPDPWWVSSHQKVQQ